MRRATRNVRYGEETTLRRDSAPAAARSKIEENDMKTDRRYSNYAPLKRAYAEERVRIYNGMKIANVTR